MSKSITVIIFVWAALFFGILSLPSIAESTNDNKAIDKPINIIPSNVMDEAQKTFESGLPCYIWRDEHTKVKASEPWPGNKIVFIGDLYVLARPTSDGVAILPCHAYMAKHYGVEDELYEHIGQTGTQEQMTASSKEKKIFFCLLTGGTDKKTGNSFELSGKSSVRIFLIDPQEQGKDAPTPISNQITMDVDTTPDPYAW